MHDGMLQQSGSGRNICFKWRVCTVSQHIFKFPTHIHMKEAADCSCNIDDSEQINPHELLYIILIFLACFQELWNQCLLFFQFLLPRNGWCSGTKIYLYLILYIFCITFHIMRFGWLYKVPTDEKREIIVGDLYSFKSKKEMVFGFIHNCLAGTWILPTDIWRTLRFFRNFT